MTVTVNLCVRFMAFIPNYPIMPAYITINQNEKLITYC